MAHAYENNVDRVISTQTWSSSA